MIPTRGSPFASSSTSGRSASQSISRDTSATSRSGALSAMSPPDFPNPRADQVSTAYPERANCSACARTSSLLPPKPCPISTAGRRPVPPAVKYEVSMDTPSAFIIRSWRCTAGPPSSAAAFQAPAPASTASAARPATHRPRPRRTGRRHLDLLASGVSMVRP